MEAARRTDKHVTPLIPLFLGVLSLSKWRHKFTYIFGRVLICVDDRFAYARYVRPNRLDTPSFGAAVKSFY